MNKSLIGIILLIAGIFMYILSYWLVTIPYLLRIVNGTGWALGIAGIILLIMEHKKSAK